MIADLPTPFSADGSIDQAAFTRLCERQVCAGASALLVADTAGESATLDMHERATLIAIARRTAHGRIRIIAGAGSNATARAIELTQLAAAAGADAVMSVVPYYNRPTQDGIVAHFRAIAAASPLPIVLHDAPARCARALDDHTLLQLVEASGIIALRDDTDDIARLSRLRARVPGFRLLCGNDANAFPYLASGGDGCISTLANIVPQLCRGMYVAVRLGQMATAATIQHKLAPLLAVLARDDTPASLKHALGLRGLVSPHLRLPLVGPDLETITAIATALDQIWRATDTAAPTRRRR
jgi:4-hydroxy-tetrahydrodipicolinate synthase